MNTILKLTITALARLFAIIVFGKSLYTDVIWIGMALNGVDWDPKSHNKRSTTEPIGLSRSPAQ